MHLLAPPQICSLPENTVQVQDRAPFLNIRERFEHVASGACEGTTPAMHYRGSSLGRAFC